MSTLWSYWLIAISTDLQKGSGLAAALDPSPRGDLTFLQGAKLRPIGSQSLTPTAWAASIPLRQSGYDVVQEFLAGRVHPTLAARGVTQQILDDALPTMSLLCGAREIYESQGEAFIAANGYERVPE